MAKDFVPAKKVDLYGELHNVEAITASLQVGAVKLALIAAGVSEEMQERAKAALSQLMDEWEVGKNRLQMSQQEVAKWKDAHARVDLRLDVAKAMIKAMGEAGAEAL